MGKPRVWVDVLTPKQVLLFAPLAEELVKRGCRVLATSRRYREIEPIARMCGFKLEYVGERGGADTAGQLVASTDRQARIIPLVRSFAPNVAVSVASAVCARVAFGLKVRHVAVNDSPHSKVAGKLSLPLSHQLMCPWIIPYSDWREFGVARSQVTRYRALDPAAWLKRPPHNGPVPKLAPGRKTIVVRVEESYAPYMVAADRSLARSVLRRVAKEFDRFNLVALCRYGEQLDVIAKDFGDKYEVPTRPIDGRRLLASTDAFVGMGGTMNAEASLMGVPTVSAFQGSLRTEDYLESVGLVARTQDPDAIVRLCKRFLEANYKERFATRAKRVLGSMEDPVPKIALKLMDVAETAVKRSS